MESSKVGYWLQVGANIGILAGLLLVAFEINENSRITRADLTARSYEHANEYVLSLMGENPTRALVKSTTSPAEMTDEELLITSLSVDYWHNFHQRYQGLVDAGFAAEQDWEAYLRVHATKAAYGGNPLKAAAWKAKMREGFGFEWERRVSQMQESSPLNADEELLETLREAAGQMAD